MALSTTTVIEFTVKTLLFLILLVLYYVLYMQMALDQLYEGRTTMAESIKLNNQLDYPVLIFCPDPGFKPSFFEEIKNNAKITGRSVTGIEKYVWKFAWFTKDFQNVSSIPEVYKNMSFLLEEDWKINLMPYSVMDDRY